MPVTQLEHDLWFAATRWDQPRHPTPWRVQELGELWSVVDANGWALATAARKPMADLIARLPDIMGEDRPRRRSGIPADQGYGPGRRRKLEEGGAHPEPVDLDKPRPSSVR